MKRWLPILAVAFVGLALIGGAASATSGWTQVRSPSPSGSAALLAVACTSASSCVAVGQSSESTLAEVRTASGWRITPTPNPAGARGEGLAGIACPASAACVAVGVALNASPFANSVKSVGSITERWNGSRWHLQATPTAHTKGAFLNAVSCSSPSACTAVGAVNHRPVAERWNGKTWTKQTVPAPKAPQAGLFGVSCPSAAHCMAVGGIASNSSPQGLGSLAEQWNGTTWQIRATPKSQGSGHSFNAIACANPSACMAVGNTNTGLLAERWNGKAWTLQPPRQPAGNGNFFSGVSCPSRSTCTAVGLAFTPSGPSTIAERWNGTKWSKQTMPPLAAGDIDPPAVSCLNPSVCTAAGGYTPAANKKTLIEQYRKP